MNVCMAQILRQSLRSPFLIRVNLDEYPAYCARWRLLQFSTQQFGCYPLLSYLLGIFEEVLDHF